MGCAMFPLAAAGPENENANSKRAMAIRLEVLETPHTRALGRAWRFFQMNAQTSPAPIERRKHKLPIGVNAALYSNASGGSRGGDIYYMSEDLRTRMLVAGVRGHGKQVRSIGSWIDASLQDRMHSIDCAGVLTDLNQLVHRRGSAAITKATVVSRDIDSTALYYSYAGRPPIQMRRPGRRWSPLVLQAQSGQSNLPLSIFPSVRYDQGEVRVQAGDCFLLYTDDLSEAMSPESDEEFGETQLPALLEAEQ